MVYRPFRFDNEKFIKRAIEYHGNKYDYSKVQYVNCKTSVIIGCPIHGDFLQVAGNHVSKTKKSGCPKCGDDTKRNNQDWFLNKAHKIHGEKFDYSNVEYFSINHYVTITCPIHGKIEITPRNHFRSIDGCPQCGMLRLTTNNWKYSIWKDSGEKSRFFDSYKVYIIKCYNDNEEFYKIGKTFNTIRKRFTGQKHLPYLYEVKREIIGDAYEISKIEELLHKEFKSSKYLPIIKFKGQEECFNMSIDVDINIYNLLNNVASESIARNKPKSTNK